LPLDVHYIIEYPQAFWKKNIEKSAQFMYCSNLPALPGTAASRHARTIDNLLDKNRIYAIKAKFSRT
jgi:hypothetical protein